MPGWRMSSRIAGFLHHARGHAGLLAQVRVHDLDRCTTRQHDVLGLVDRTHPAAADLLHQPVRTDDAVRPELDGGFRGHAGALVQEPCREIRSATCVSASGDRSGIARARSQRRPLARGVLLSARRTMVEVPSKLAPATMGHSGSAPSSAHMRSSGCSAPAGWARSTGRATSSTNRIVALKVLREDQLEQDRAVDRMMREASILATVAARRHPAVLRVRPLARRTAVDCDGARRRNAALGAHARGPARVRRRHGLRRQRGWCARSSARPWRHAPRSQARQHPADAHRRRVRRARD